LGVRYGILRRQLTQKLWVCPGYAYQSTNYAVLSVRELKEYSWREQSEIFPSKGTAVSGRVGEGMMLGKSRNGSASYSPGADIHRGSRAFRRIGAGSSPKV
jgi:hypothetical protein